MSSVPVLSASILMVDDNKDGLTARRHVLDELGHKTVTVSSAQAALDAFVKQKFDLVITDYKMPDMSGITLIQKLRAVNPAVPVILISGFVTVLGLDEGTTGADVVIMKSANEVPLLLRHVARLLNRKPARKPPSGLSGDPRKKRSS